MKITRSQIRKIIKEAIINEYGPQHGLGTAEQINQRLRGTPRRPERKAHGWMEFIELAQARDYDAAGNWINELASDYGIELSREAEDGFIELAAGEGASTQELSQAFQAFVAQHQYAYRH
jgi:hypothetical protein